MRNGFWYSYYKNIPKNNENEKLGNGFIIHRKENWLKLIFGKDDKKNQKEKN